MWTAPIAAYGSGAIVSMSGVAAARIGASSCSHSIWVAVDVNRTATVSRPASGAGTPGMSGSCSSAIDVFACSGRSCVHSRHVQHARGVRAVEEQRAAVDLGEREQLDLDRRDHAQRALPAAQAPEQLRVLGRRGAQQPPVTRDDLEREHVSDATPTCASAARCRRP